MVWGQISAFALASLILVNPAWGNARGNFTGEAYARHIVPLPRSFWLQTCLQYQHYIGYPEYSYFPEHQAIAMQDNSSIPRSRIAEEAIDHPELPLKTMLKVFFLCLIVFRRLLMHAGDLLIIIYWSDGSKMG